MEEHIKLAEIKMREEERLVFERKKDEEHKLQDEKDEILRIQQLIINS